MHLVARPLTPEACYTSTVGSMVAPLVAINSGFSLASGVAIFGPDGSIATVGPSPCLWLSGTRPEGLENDVKMG